MIERQQQQQNKAHMAQEHNSPRQLQFICCTAVPSGFLTLIQKQSITQVLSEVQCNVRAHMVSLV